MKILIIGSVGSGKTTFSKKLCEIYCSNFFEIDLIVHDDKNGIKRSIYDQNLIISEINKNKDWIIEGTLRKNLYFLLDIAEKIIFIDISIMSINFRILKRFIKQILKIEKCNYKPTFKMLKSMYKWSFDFYKNKKNFNNYLNKYKNKLVVIKNNKELYNFYNTKM